MNSELQNPAFVAYAMTCILLLVHLLFLWLYSGYVRAKTKTAPNPEDAARRGTTLREFDPPDVARVLRIHVNGEASVYPFLFLGLVFVLAGGSAGFAKADFALFVGARILHSVMYLFGKQPWRTIFYALSLAALAALLIQIVLILVRATAL